MRGPSRKSHGVLLENSALTTSGDGITGSNGSILNVPVRVGSETGVCTVTVFLDDGNRSATTLIVE